MSAGLERTRCAPRWRQCPLLSFGLDHAETENCGDFISVRGLKTNGDFLFALHQRCGHRVFDIEEMHSAALCDGLLAKLLAFHQHVERSFAPFIAIITDDEGHRMGRINR